MMNGLKQSDSAIVPMSAANKGTSVPAESKEGRAGTKGNPRRQSTHRTQGRARVSHAAERIRQTATRKPKEKLTALLQAARTGRFRHGGYTYPSRTEEHDRNRAD